MPGGGGTLIPSLCTLPKGGVAHDRAKYGSHLSVPCGRLPAHGESHASGHELARHKLGATAGPHADGCERYLPRGQRGRRGTAYADGGGDSVTRTHIPIAEHWRINSGLAAMVMASKCSAERKSSGYISDFDAAQWRRSAAQQLAPVPCGVHLASDSLSSPERGCAA